MRTYYTHKRTRIRLTGPIRAQDVPEVACEHFHVQLRG